MHGTVMPMWKAGMNSRTSVTSRLAQTKCRLGDEFERSPGLCDGAALGSRPHASRSTRGLRSGTMRSPSESTAVTLQQDFLRTGSLFLRIELRNPVGLDELRREPAANTDGLAVSTPMPDLARRAGRCNRHWSAASAVVAAAARLDLGVATTACCRWLSRRA